MTQTLVEQEIKSLVSFRYVFCRLALIPLGGSMVIFDPFWRMNTGNLLLGRLVSQSRKSLCTFREFMTCVWFGNKEEHEVFLSLQHYSAVQHVFVNVQTFTGSMFSMSLSREGIQLGARWQFWKKTHWPCSMAARIMVSAQGPWIAQTTSNDNRTAPTTANTQVQQPKQTIQEGLGGLSFTQTPWGMW